VTGVDLVLVTDRRLVGRPLPELIREAALAGVDWVQLREKDLPGRGLLDLARECLSALAGTRSRLLVNGRADVAEAAGAHGVQLPEAGLPVSDVKRSFPALIVSASRHSLEGARRAEAEGADLLLVGPVFPTPGKPDALGLAAFEEIARGVSIPVHAIGGLDAETARSVADAGARGLAAIRAFGHAPADGVRALREALR
jgi:thiamine-phosphate diphosphorylase